MISREKRSKETGGARSGARAGRVWTMTLAAVLAVVAGCASPEARIKRNAGLFNQLAPEEQALIREGRVALGFTPAMVELAVGEPDRRWTRDDAQGRTEIWSYTTFETTAGTPLYRGWYHRAYGGYPFYADTMAAAKARDYFKVSFVGGRVTAVEQDVR